MGINKNKASLEEIYVLKGIAIIGVIILHMYIPLINRNIHGLSLKIVAQFSMPIFMFLSGYLFGYSNVAISSFSDYTGFVTKKFKRLMIPYFIISGIILFLKGISGKYVTLAYPITVDFWKYLLFNPVKGFAPFLWYLYILFIVFLIFPILSRLFKNTVLLFLFIVSMLFISIPKILYFNHAAVRTFLLFFCVGYLFSNSIFENNKLFRYPLLIISLILFTVFIVNEGMIIRNTFMVFGDNPATDLLLKTLFQLSGIMVFYYLSVFIKNTGGYLFRVLKFIGLFSASIYLLHSISMGAARVLLIDVIQFNVTLYHVVSILIFISGIVLPILMTKYFIAKFNFLPPLILGLKKSS